MSRLVNFFTAVAEKPMQAVEGILAFLMIASPLWVLGPYYQPENAVNARIWESVGIAKGFAIFQLINAMVLLFALVRPNWTKRRVVRRWTTFVAFNLYLFYGFSGAIILGFGRVTWFSTFALAFIAGVLHLRLKWELSENAGN